MVAACADRGRDRALDHRRDRPAYGRLHQLGWAHSVEAWSLDDGTLAGGLYGVAIGGLFAGESMFHRRTDASKVALVGAGRPAGRAPAPGPGGCSTCSGAPTTWPASAWSRSAASEYRRRLAAALPLPLPPAFS